jgi:hypothetical protein
MASRRTPTSIKRYDLLKYFLLIVFLVCFLILFVIGSLRFMPGTLSVISTPVATYTPEVDELAQAPVVEPTVDDVVTDATPVGSGEVIEDTLVSPIPFGVSIDSEQPILAGIPFLVTGEAPPGSNIYFRVQDSLVAETVTGDDGQWEVFVSLEPSGLYEVTVEGVDLESGDVFTSTVSLPVLPQIATGPTAIVASTIAVEPEETAIVVPIEDTPEPVVEATPDVDIVTVTETPDVLEMETPDPTADPLETPDAELMLPAVVPTVELAPLEDLTPTPDLTPTETPLQPVVIHNIIQRMRPGGMQVTGSAQPGSAVEIIVDDDLIVTTTVDADGLWSVDLLGLVPGIYRFEAYQVDAERNLMGEVVVIEAEVPDVVGIATPTITPTPALAATGLQCRVDPTQATVGEVVRIHGVGQPGTNVEIYIGGTTVGGVVVAEDGTWYYDVVFATPGIQYIGCSGVDASSTPVYFPLASYVVILPQPTPIETETPEPTPTVTPEPTETPEPTPTVTPEPTPTETPAPTPTEPP